MAALPREAFFAATLSLGVSMGLSILGNFITSFFWSNNVTNVPNNTLINATNSTGSFVGSTVSWIWTLSWILFVVIGLGLGALKYYTIQATKDYYERVARKRFQGKLPLPKLHPFEAPSFTMDGDGSRKAFKFTNSLGIQIATYHWSPPSPKAVVMYVHGLDSSAEVELSNLLELPKVQYKGSFAEKLVEAGFSVWSMDNNGHGKSDSVVSGVRGACMDFDDYVDDLVSFQGIVAKQQPQLPFFVVGSSMGGTLCLRLSELVSDKIVASVALCPAVKFEKAKAKPINKILFPLVDVVSKHFPLLAVGDKDPHPDPKIFAWMHASDSPFNRNRLRARMATEFMRSAEVILANVLEIQKPLLLIHAPKDTFVDYEGSEIVLATACNSKAELLSECGTDWHDILHHHNGIKVAGTKAVNWMTALL